MRQHIIPTKSFFVYHIEQTLFTEFLLVWPNHRYYHQLIHSKLKWIIRKCVWKVNDGLIKLFFPALYLWPRIFLPFEQYSTLTKPDIIIGHVPSLIVFHQDSKKYNTYWNEYFSIAIWLVASNLVLKSIDERFSSFTQTATCIPSDLDKN